MSKKEFLGVEISKIANNRLFFTESDKAAKIEDVNIHTNSYQWFLQDGIKEPLEEISPIEGFSENSISLEFLSHRIEAPKFTPEEVKEKNTSYEGSVKVFIRLLNKKTGEVKEQEVYLGTVPFMTDAGVFIRNGIERVVVSRMYR